MPKFVCKETMFIGYIAFYKGKSYTPLNSYESGYYFTDEYATIHQMNTHEINKFFNSDSKKTEILSISMDLNYHY